ncbi:UvrD-helicase domain-containing protein [Rossellomorea aquimaris]|uniref:UvrD-helicase domain-containing protein n=1 Tax=Rossellomorea aquimaris TaxID=189382 RepID=UPI0007D0AD09|nr:UvrD-helicase domain-containing protein [Rossellomorea aquimaris]
MFIEGTVVDYRPGIDAERLVWDHVKSLFSKRDSFGFLHFPMFKKNHSEKREIDILLLDREFGATVIEVKGITIDNIVGIQGHKWLYEDFYTKQGEPYNQAMQQLNMLCDDIEKKALLYRSFTKRAVVALPYITSTQWKEKGFDELLTNPPILFKDDFIQGTWVRKLDGMEVYKARKPLNDHKWLLLKKHFYIKEHEEMNLGQKRSYSRLYLFHHKQNFLREKEAIEASMREGVKIYLFTTFPLEKAWLDTFKSFRKDFQFQVFVTDKWKGPLETVVMKDGKGDVGFLKDFLAPAFPDFNYGQFTAAHTLPSNHLMITAGAGTGKTYVMIDRILYLVEMADITMKDIVMITFTNSSTNEMKERLQKKLLTMFELTGKTKYLLLAEDVKNMQISTIHSFSKTILTQLAHELGFGRNMKLRSFIKKKKEIIERLADEYFKIHPITDLISLKFNHYEVVNLMNNFWDEMEKKGLTKEEIQKLEWGMAIDERYTILHNLFKYVFTRCETMLEIEKKKENAIDMGDLIRKLKLFTRDGDKMKQLETEKYLFVDEFQDSDNTQIELVANLQILLDYKLFVVGDVKQSIYRFRGADYTSFERLKEFAKKNNQSGFVPISLNQNYRTTKSLLNELDKLFLVWGQKRWGKGGNLQSLLPYSQEDRLIGMDIDSEDNEFCTIESKAKELEVNTVLEIQNAFQHVEKLSEKENKKIALIVRTNKQALEVLKWCDRAKLGTVQNLDGTFFKSDAVLHFKMLLDALMYPHEATHMVNVLQSPYFGYSIPGKLLVPFKGDDEKIIKFLRSHLEGDFDCYLEDLRLLPATAVIQKVISEKGLLRNVEGFYKSSIDNENTLRNAIKQYEKNLFHLVNLIQQQFDSMNGTLWRLHEWLSLQIRVNRTENEPMIKTESGAVEITTVHRSKGLEYHTVIIPKVGHKFTSDRTTFYVQDEKEMEGHQRMVGWSIKEHTENDRYSSLNSYEKFEVEREETRLLYVAMTRAKKRLILLMPKRVQDFTWGFLLDQAIKGAHNEDKSLHL